MRQEYKTEIKELRANVSSMRTSEPELEEARKKITDLEDEIRNASSYKEKLSATEAQLEKATIKLTKLDYTVEYLCMALVVAAMDAESGTPCGAANLARVAAVILPENAARRARAARRGASVRRVNKAQEEEDTE